MPKPTETAKERVERAVPKEQKAMHDIMENSPDNETKEQMKARMIKAAPVTHSTPQQGHKLIERAMKGK